MFVEIYVPTFEIFWFLGKSYFYFKVAIFKNSRVSIKVSVGLGGTSLFFLDLGGAWFSSFVTLVL